MKDPTEPNVFLCNSCHVRYSARSARDWDADGYYQYFAIYKHESGAHYCGHCRRCRACAKNLEPKNIYSPLPPLPGLTSARHHGPLCQTCQEQKTEVSKIFGPLRRDFTESNGKPLKNILRLSTQIFKLKDYAELKNDKGQIIQVGWFMDEMTGRMTRISQFRKTEKFNSKGKPIPNRFDRRGTLKFKDELYNLDRGINFANLFSFMASPPTHVRNYIYLCRAIGYRVIGYKARGRKDYPHTEWHTTLKEEKIEEKKRQLDYELHDLVKDDLRAIENRYKNRKERLSWIEEDV